MRAEPKMLTEGLMRASRSKPSTNSAMIWKIFQDSRVSMVSLTGSRLGWPALPLPLPWGMSIAALLPATRAVPAPKAAARPRLSPPEP